MKICIALATAVLAMTGCLRTASAALILSDNFDGYADQAAFQVAWPAIGTVAPTSAELSIAQSSSAPQSIRVPGTLTNSQSRNRRSFAESGSVDTTHRVNWSFDFYDGAPTANPARNYSNLQDTIAPGSTNQLVAMGFNNNQVATNSGGQFYMARILGYTVPTTPDPDGGPTETVGGAGAFFKLNDFGAGARSLGWHNLKVILSTDNGLSTDYAFYVDNVLAEIVSNIGTAASIRSYDNIVLGSGLSNASTEAFFDNVRLEYVPEPSTIALTGVFLGLAACASRRRAA